MAPSYQALRDDLPPPPLVDFNELLKSLQGNDQLIITSKAAAKPEPKPESESESEEADTPKEPVVYAPNGSIASVKNLYQGKPDNRGKSTWTLDYPDDIEEPPENAESAQYALLLRHEKCYNGRQKLQLHSILLQSKMLKDVLGEKVLKDYPGIVTNLERVEFKPPFEPFVHRWADFEAAREACADDPTAKEHIEVLWNVLTEELKDTIKERDDHLSHGVVRFDNIWMIFEPGMLVYAHINGEERVFRFRSGTFGQTSCGDRFYNLQCEFVDFDGTNFGTGVEFVKIWEFGGTQQIVHLDALPLKHHPEAEAVRSRCEMRGRSFEKLSGYHFRSYEGVAIGWNYEGREVKHNVNSRVILDTDAFNRFNPNRQVYLSPLTKNEGADDFSDSDSYAEDSDDDTDGGSPGREKRPLTKEELLLATPVLKGYSLKDKRWLKFTLANVKDIVWNDEAFSSLVAPAEQKELILAFAQSQAANKHRFDDVIQGKGQGIIMLLSGPPGVGKTLTAESVAEVMRVPLYTMSAGDLGTRPQEVETALNNILALNTKWNAVLLLDEADVFLEARSAHDLERNKLVSIFLRLLEYYEGILFLTTNRVDNIDAAFESRIHLSLEYDELDLASRRHVWANFIKRVVNAGEFSDAELDSLARQQLNGRQIKNVLKTAQLLAAKQEAPLSFQQVDTVMRLRAQNKSKQAFSLDKAKLGGQPA